MAKGPAVSVPQNPPFAAVGGARLAYSSLDVHLLSRFILYMLWRIEHGILEAWSSQETWTGPLLRDTGRFARMTLTLVRVIFRV